MKQLQHLAIIMDGNGRWAEAQGKKRINGHERGAEVIRDITTFCSQRQIGYLTLYAFSTENWKRPKAEVSFLMKLLERYLEGELAHYLEHGIRFKAIGDISIFSKKLIKKIQEVEEKTAACAGLTQILALNYGSQDEIVRAAKRVQDKGQAITHERLSANLDTAFAPNVDMLIRTGGEQRLSNFLLWQSSYAELFFTSTFWPDFTKEELAMLIDSFLGRQRRFGGI